MMIPAQFLAPSAGVQNAEELGMISELTRDLVRVDAEIERLEKELKSAQKQRKHLTEVVIPERMQSLGIASINTMDGHSLTLKPFYQASIRRLFEKGPCDPEAFAWLDSNGHGGVINAAVEVTFGRGELKEAQKLVDILKEWKLYSNRTELTQSVHTQTLKALCKEIMEAGKALPSEHFNVYSGQMAVVKLAKTLSTGAGPVE